MGAIVSTLADMENVVPFCAAPLNEKDTVMGTGTGSVPGTSEAVKTVSSPGPTESSDTVMMTKTLVGVFVGDRVAVLLRLAERERLDDAPGVNERDEEREALPVRVADAAIDALLLRDADAVAVVVGGEVEGERVGVIVAVRVGMAGRRLSRKYELPTITAPWSAKRT
jgi:hypothetical protein